MVNCDAWMQPNEQDATAQESVANPSQSVSRVRKKATSKRRITSPNAPAGERPTTHGRATGSSTNQDGAELSASLSLSHANLAEPSAQIAITEMGILPTTNLLTSNSSAVSATCGKMAGSRQSQIVLPAGLKPYYNHAGICIIHGDCREVLPQLWSCIDAVVTDPPYGMANDADYSRFSGGNTRRGPGTKHNDIVGDDAYFDPSMLLNFDKCVIWGANHFWDKLPAAGCAIWIKRNDHAFGTFLSDAEIAFIAGIKGVYCFRRVFAGSQKAVDAGFDAYIPSAHPNQKPVELMTWCLRFVGDAKTIGDPYMGSGTTLVAAKLAGKSAIGIEIEEKYCEIAAKRLSQEVFQFEGTE